MKIASFNVNGLRARLHQLHALIELHEPDIIGLQETKIADDIFPYKKIEKLGYKPFFYGQKNHYGVAFLTKMQPKIIQYGFPNENKDTQRRLIIIEIHSAIGDITIINGYFPQGENRNHPSKFIDKKKFFNDLQNYVFKKISITNLVLVIGDINIAITDLDIGIGEYNYKRWLRDGKCAFLPEERILINDLLKIGLIDTWREKYPKVYNKFSWFDYRSKGFNDNRGLRIDVILASNCLAKLCIESGIDYQIRSMDKPSDHAPVWSKFQI